MFFYGIKFFKKIWRAHDRQTMTQALNLPQDLVVFFYVCIFLDRLDVLVNHANAIIEQANCRVLRVQMIGHRGLHKRVAA